MGVVSFLLTFLETWLVGGLVAIFYFPRNIGLLIIPSDFHIFQRGGPTTKQMKWTFWNSLRPPRSWKSDMCWSPSENLTEWFSEIQGIPTQSADSKVSFVKGLPSGTHVNSRHCWMTLKPCWRYKTLQNQSLQAEKRSKKMSQHYVNQ